MGFLAGQYTATFNSLALGQTAEGWRLSHQFFKQLITGDAFGKAPQDAVYQGIEVFLGGTLIEYNAAGAAAAFWPVSNTLLNPGVIGRLDVGGGSGMAKAVVLTALAGTPAVATPATITLTYCALAEGFPVELLFYPGLREVPLRFRSYPNPASSNTFGSTT